MKNSKRILWITLMTAVVVSACAQQYDPESDFKAKPVDGGKGVEITEYVGSKWEVRIPPKIQGLPVTHIGNNAFRGKNLVSVTLPNGVTHIGSGAFFNNQLTSITIPESVTSIGGSTFGGNQLTSVTIGSGVTSIGTGAFSDYDSLTTINVASGNNSYSSVDGVLYNKNRTTLIAYPKGKTNVSFIMPNSVTSIGQFAFGSCINLTSVTIPNSVTSIDEYAFYNCTSLTSITIPNSVQSIGDYAFDGCTGITGRFLEVIKTLADTMSKFESISVQERRDQYDNILSVALTSQSEIIRIFSIWKPNAIDGMDSRNIERPGSTPRGQYAPVFAKENGAIEKSTFIDVNDSMTYLTGPNSRKELLKPMRFKAKGQDIWILIIEIPIINPRTNEVMGIVGGYCDIR
jgi:hypothetical protein